MDEQRIYDRVLEKMTPPSPPGVPHLTRVLKKLMTPQEAEMLLEMPAWLEELAEKWEWIKGR